MDEEQEISDQEIDAIVNSISDDDILSEYDEDELMLVPSEEIDESVIELNEILSRTARIKAKVRMRRTEVKREVVSPQSCASRFFSIKYNGCTQLGTINLDIIFIIIKYYNIYKIIIL